MKRLARFTKVGLFALTMLCLGVVVAQEVPGIGDILELDWAQVFVNIGAAAGAINLITAVVGRWVPAVTGPSKLFFALGLGLVGFGVADFLGFVTSEQFSSLPPPLEGMVFGLFAALSAVGLHQTAKQTGTALRQRNTRNLQ